MGGGRGGRYSVRAGAIKTVAAATIVVLMSVVLVVAGPGAAPAGASGPAVVSVGSVAVVEGDLTSAGSVQARVPIMLSAPQADDVVVQYSTGTGSATAGVDYAPRVNKTIKIPAGRTSATVPVMIWGDTDVEGDETFSVQLTAVLAGGVGIDAATGTGTVTILDDDPASGVRLGIADQTVVETDSGEAAVSLNLTLSEPVGVPVVVNWSVTGGTATAGVDYRISAGTTTIPAGRTRGHTVKQWIQGDLDLEVDETIQVTISTPTPGVTVTRPVGTLTLTNNDTQTLWAWGWNNARQLGQCCATTYSTPTQVGTDTDWTEIEGGYQHSLAIRTDGTLWAWGRNDRGELGLGYTSTTVSTPTQVGTDTWQSVSGGSSISQFSVGVKTDGSLWSWGYNLDGQLGLGDTTPRTSPTRVGTANDWAVVSAGDAHVLALRTDGTLWAWGSNGYGKLGLGDTTARLTPTQVGSDNDWVSIAAGSWHSLAIKADGTLWAWGYNAYGQLGLGDTTNRLSPVQVGTDSDWAAVAAGAFHTVALKTDGTLWAWGYNIFGQLGLGDTSNRLSPSRIGTASDWGSVAAGRGHTVALKTDGTLWAWGWNNNGQLGLGDTSDRLLPEQVGTSARWWKIACGDYHSLAISR